jgi:hypothetical protein
MLHAIQKIIRYRVKMSAAAWERKSSPYCMKKWHLSSRQEFSVWFICIKHLKYTI